MYLIRLYIPYSILSPSLPLSRSPRPSASTIHSCRSGPGPLPHWTPRFNRPPLYNRYSYFTTPPHIICHIPPLYNTQKLLIKQHERDVELNAATAFQAASTTPTSANGQGILYIQCICYK